MLTPVPSMPAIATGFVRKLYRILDQESGAVISWTRGGTAFAIFDDERLNELILPKYFRGRLCAFRQQLREHGFQQLLANELAVPITPVASDSNAEQCTYFHEHFVRGSPGRLSKITRTPLPRRRISSRKGKSAGAATGKRAAPSVNAAVVAMKTDVKSSNSMSNKRARVDTTAASSSASTASTDTLSSSSSSFGSSSSSSSGPASASLPSVSTSSISILKGFSFTGTAPVVRYQQPQQQPRQQQQQQQVKKNPLFSNESDPIFGDWLNLDDISPATGTSSTGCSTAGVTTDISFSEDVLGALMNLVNTSMSTASVTGPASASPTSSCGSATSCAAQQKKICNGTSTSSLNNNSNSRGVCSVKKKAMATGAVYETHQFSEDTINSMMLWLGTSGST